MSELQTRYCIGDSFTGDCEHATIKKTKVEPYSVLLFEGNRLISARMDDVSFPVFCNHPSRAEETQVGYAEPYSTCSCDTCPMLLPKPTEENFFKKLWRKATNYFN